MTDDVNERIVARVRHCKPMSTKPQDVDVFVPKKCILVIIIIRVNIQCKLDNEMMTHLENFTCLSEEKCFVQRSSLVEVATPM